MNIPSLLKIIREEMLCDSCHGSGAISTPSSHDPCSDCDGYGFRVFEGSGQDCYEAAERKIENGTANSNQ